MSEGDDERDSKGTLEIAVFRRRRRWMGEIQDELGTRRVALAAERLIVGSAASADVVVSDPTVSARHLALWADEESVGFEDLGSKNGTFVAGARVREARSDSGTTVLLGRSSITFVALNQGEEQTIEDAEPLDGVAGGSLAMRTIARRVRRMAATTLPVLVTGETGTGKELIARALHTEGVRAQGSFVALNVASLPRELVESELFGHERGAFTGATSRRIGAFTEADGGTLFLDEIGDMPLDAQPKLLRALDGYEVRRVGSTGRGRAHDVRIVAATNRDLGERVDKGEFRRDLYHRLSILQVKLPALRERRGDIAPIARAILARAPQGVTARELTPRALGRLLGHDWPGNVRELRAVLYRANEHAEGARILDLEDVEEGLRAGGVVTTPIALRPNEAEALLREHRGNVSQAARAAGVPRSTFRKRLRRT